MNTELYRDGLKPYLPEGTEELIAQWLVDLKVHLTLYEHRKTKYGDFRAPTPHSHGRISVNISLNPYSFLITLVHEIAHGFVYQKHGRKVKPHGTEWKEEYRNRLIPFLQQRIFPQEIEPILAAHMQNPKASVVGDITLEKALRQYDTHVDEKLYLDDLQEGDKFLVHGRVFTKGKKRRTRHLCVEQASGRTYTISGIAEVKKVE